MSKLVGIVRRNEFAGGWVLETERGERYELRGAVGELADGLAAEVEGRIERELMGIGMSGPMFTVERVTRR